MKRIITVILAAFFAVGMAFGITITDELKDMANQLVQTKSTGGKPSYAFVSFTTDYKNTLVDDYITDALIEAMFNTGKVKIVERSNLEAILKEQKFQASGLVNEETAKSIGKIVGVDFVCYGTLKDLDYSFSVNARVVDVETGELCAIARATVTKDDYLKKQPQKAVGSHSYVAGASTKSSETTTRAVVSVEDNAWEVAKSVDEFGNCIYYTFIVKSSEQQFLFINYKKANNPANSRIIVGIHWFKNGWQNPRYTGDQAGTYEIKGKNGDVITKKCDNNPSWVDISNDAWNAGTFCYAWDSKNSGRWLVEMMKDSDNVAVRRDDMTRRFQTAGLLDKMAEYGITWEEIDAALANEEF